MQLDGFDDLFMATHQFLGQRKRYGKLYSGCQYRGGKDGHYNGGRTDFYH